MLQTGQPFLIELLLGALAGHQSVEVGMAEGYIEAQPALPFA